MNNFIKIFNDKDTSPRGESSKSSPRGVFFLELRSGKKGKKSVLRYKQLGVRNKNAQERIKSERGKKRNKKLKRNSRLTRAKPRQ